ncbi:MAG: BON domain-containing protein [Burkholderiales bacterium]|nr:BON domain-containing protein [Burkholderiales bacterium]
MKIMKQRYLFALLAGVGLLATGCSTEAPFKVNASLTAPYITDSENQKDDGQALSERLDDVLDAQIPTNKIKVVVDHYNVLLVGQVASNTDKATAETICKKWPSTQKIFNYLTVNAQPSLNMNSSITSDATKRISMQYDIEPTAITVTTVDNVVYIMGTNIGNLSALDEAIKGIYSISNVNKVVNLEQKGSADYVTN